MFTIPGWLVSALTFPGIIVHEWAHKKFCDWCGVKVLKVVYFKFSQDEDVAGYVAHERPTTYLQTVLISVGPLLINSVITLLLASVASTMLEGSKAWSLIVYWLALCVGLHAFPSDHDADHIDLASKNKISEGNLLYLLAIPFLGLIKVTNRFGAFLGLAWSINLVLIGSALGGLAYGLFAGG